MNRLIVFFFLLITIHLSAQLSQQARDSIRSLSKADHQLMLQELGISELRPGPSYDFKAPNAANCDESKASPYTSVPDPLVFNNGSAVKNASDWEKRKHEIFEDFDREVYGRFPANLPAVRWEVVREKDTIEGQTPLHLQWLQGIVDNSSCPAISVVIDLIVGTPVLCPQQVPLVMELSWNTPSGTTPSWKEQLLKKGWGFALLISTSFQADNGAGLRSGIIGLVNKGQLRKPDDWGALKAWAWGASRAIDYFESENRVDEKRIAIEGLSRYGKAALVAMAYDPRIAVGFIGSSGAGGAKLLRRVYGEQVENLAGPVTYHWFAPNFLKYAGPLTPNDLPVDAHELIALCAPRPVFISSGSLNVEGHWIDARGMFVSEVLAGPVYTLLGKTDLGVAEMPAEETSLTSTDLAFRQHSGGHTVEPNWPYFIEFASRYFEPVQPQK